ncbi:gp53-like domain-containing protein [Serratia oryzae]|uniref:Putative tail fiber protein gp53-like C-terminal domain-containing protein n=1 Tax=Serratia oryzae TaxID=2034155 RepID=A0A1S8CQH9_9GAMM|nr:hypothetical protein [Serratia oryzae]OMQ26921.1 hypothetical protein BMI79_00915 [Serratia oryzae]
MILGFGNNIRSALAADINSTQTVIAVMPGTGALFAKTLQAEASLVNPSYTSTLYSKLTLTDELETVFEICHLVSVSGDNLTVIRGQEMTKAKGWSLNDVVSNFPTRGSENNFVQIEDLQSGKYLSATAGGSANALTVSIPSTFYVNGGNTFALRAPLLVTPTQTNTGAVTVQLTVSGRVVGTYPILKGVNSPLEAGDITVSIPVIITFSSELSCFFMTNPGRGLVDSGAFLLKANNLSDLPNTNTARTNLGLGSMATQNTNNVMITGGTIHTTGEITSDGSISSSGKITTLGGVTSAGDITTSSGIFDKGQRVYSFNNPPPYPVTSVNGITGNVSTGTASLGITGWSRDAATGMIEQWGIITRTGYVTPVSFPTTFPNRCVGVFLTLNTTISNLADSTNNLRAVDTYNGGFTYASAGVAEISAFWMAKGY